MGGVAVYYQI